MAVRFARLDFLGAGPFSLQNRRSRALDSFGFPWILSSESSLFNGLHGENREFLFLSPWWP